MRDPMWMSGDDAALDIDDIEEKEDAEYNDAEDAWECDNDK